MLSRELRGNGGPYAATRAAFGPLAGFVVAWGYWVSIWVGNVTIATGAVSYTSTLAPWIANVKGAAPLLTVAVVWLFTLVNSFGVRASGWVQSVTTVLKCLPLVAVPLAAFVRFRPEWVSDLAAGPPIWLDGTAAAARTLWAVVGFESATVPADKVEDPARTIPARRSSERWSARSCVRSRAARDAAGPEPDPRARTRRSRTPRASCSRRRGRRRHGAGGRSLRRLNGWILLQGELPQQMARAGVFPRLFAQTSGRGAPVFALVDECPGDGAGVDEFRQQHGAGIHLHGAALDHGQPGRLPRLLARALALQRRGEIASRKPGWLAATAALGAAFSLWAIAGAGLEPVLWGAVLILCALPVYWLMRRSGLSRPEPAQP